MRVGYAGETESIISRVWIHEMQQRGVNPVVLAAEAPTWDVEWQPIVVSAPPVKGLGIGRALHWRATHDAIARAQVDLLHWHFAAPWAWGRYKHPFVVSAWGSDVLLAREKTASYRRGMRRTLSVADVVLCCAQHVKDAAIRLGARSRTCELVGWGVDTNEYRREPSIRARIRAEWEVPPDGIVILSTRRLEPLYRHSLMIEALCHGLLDNPKVCVVIASHGSLEGDLRRQVAERDLAERVRFLGKIPETGWPSMAAVYGGGDIYCSVPRSDGAPLSVLEAMASGLPVVATDLPTMRDWVQATGAGFLWTGDDPKRLAQCLLSAVLNRERLGSAAREYVCGHQERRAHMDRGYAAYERSILPR